MNQTDTWCCPNTQLCGEQVGECKDSDGKCAYYFGVTEDDSVVYYGDCSYTCSKGGASTTYGANCSYVVGTTGGLTGYTDAAGTARNYALPGVQSVQGCPGNQYCAIFWTQPEWPHGSATPTVAAAAVGTLYGRCQMMNSYESTPLSKTKTGAAAGYHV